MDAPRVSWPASTPPVTTAWPRSAQLTAAFLLGVAGALVSVHAVGSSRWGTRPTETYGQNRSAYQIDLNAAGKPELLQLPGVGESLAERIDAYRREYGGFRQVEDLQEIHGVGPATLERLRPWVRAQADAAATEGLSAAARAAASGNGQENSGRLDAECRGEEDCKLEGADQRQSCFGRRATAAARRRTKDGATDYRRTRQEAFRVGGRPSSSVRDRPKDARTITAVCHCRWHIAPGRCGGPAIMITQFELGSEFQPAGDQPHAIDKLVQGFRDGRPQQTLMGVTGSGKTFTAANVIAQIGRPTLVLSHNKTLAAQLYKEFRGFFPHNAVHYFVSYYDYYQPEAYIPQRDIYIEKDAQINENIDRLRLAATSALVSRKDVIIVASVSCIYGLGSPSDYKRMMVHLVKGQTVVRDEVLLRLVDIQYERNDVAFTRGTFRVRGDVLEIWPAYEEYAFRIELFGDEIDGLAIINPISGETLRIVEEVYIYPAKHFVTPDERIREAVEGIRGELEQRLTQFREQGKLLEAQRLGARTRFDLEMLLEVGHCPGIENYRAGSAAGSPENRPIRSSIFSRTSF